MGRPMWATASALYSWIAGMIKLLAGLGIVILAAASVDTLRNALNSFGGGMFFGAASSPLTILLLVGFTFMLTSILGVVAGYGMWMLQGWGRMTALINHGLCAIIWLVGAVAFFMNSSPAMGSLCVLAIIINLTFLVGLILPPGGAAYGGGGFGPPRHPPHFGGAPPPSPAPPAMPMPDPAPLLPPTQMAPAAPTGAYGRAGAAPAGVARTEMANAEPLVLAWLVEHGGPRSGKEHRLMQQVTIGRDPNRCEVVLDEGKVSGEHARIRMEQGAFVLYDLASTNHTYVNGQQVQKHTLRDGDKIRCGPNTMLVFMRVGK